MGIGDTNHIRAEIHLMIMASKTMKKLIIRRAWSPKILKMMPNPLQKTINPGRRQELKEGLPPTQYIHFIGIHEQWFLWQVGVIHNGAVYSQDSGLLRLIVGLYLESILRGDRYPPTCWNVAWTIFSGNMLRIWSRKVSRVDRAVSSSVPLPSESMRSGEPGWMEETKIIPV